MLFPIQNDATMRGLNKVTLIGNVGKDPDVKMLEHNVKVAKCSVATTETYKDEHGQSHSVTDWHTVILWRGLADLAEKYLHKGSLVYVEGKLKTRSYNDKEGQKRNVTEVIAEQIILLDKKTEDV
jgi:single-strand DNA-binding protein